MFSYFTGKPAQKALAPREKLQGFYQLAEEALARAYEADTNKRTEAAIKLYRTALEAIQEGLQLQVEGSGLGPKADSVAGWKSELARWQQEVTRRLRVLESGAATISAPAGPVRPSRSVNLPIQGSQGPSSPPAARMARSGGGDVPTRTHSLLSARSSTQPAAIAALQPAGSSAGAATATAPPHISKEDQKYRDAILGEVLDTTPTVSWDEIAGLKTAKQALMEAVVLPALRPDIYQGLRAPVRGILLFGPPGNGKTMLGKALAHEAKATFFNISASSLTSKWMGEGEKLVRALFAVATERQPAIIFIDEVDSILSSRGGKGENEAMRRLLTEFLVQFDGVSGGAERLVVVGATNRPQELDEAVRRRLVKRIYIPLPDSTGRMSILQHLLKGQPVKLGSRELQEVVRSTQGYSASDLNALCKEAAMGPVRELGAKIAHVPVSQIRPVSVQDFAAALRVIRPSGNEASLKAYEDFTREFGTV